jgi:transcriptional regulator with XRE-family HTH domain
MNLSSRFALVARLKRSRKARKQFVESHVANGTAFQIKATRDALGWTQEKLAAEAEMNQNAIYRLESPAVGRPTLTTLKRIAAAMDVGLIVRFVPFSEMVDWVSGTPRIDHGLTNRSLAVPSFERELENGSLETSRSEQAWATLGRNANRRYKAASGGQMNLTLDDPQRQGGAIICGNFSWVEVSVPHPTPSESFGNNYSSASGAQRAS